MILQNHVSNKLLININLDKIKVKDFLSYVFIYYFYLHFNIFLHLVKTDNIINIV